MKFKPIEMGKYSFLLIIKEINKGCIPLFLLLSISFPGLLTAQQLTHGLELGDQFYSEFKYSKAAKEYEKLVIRKNPNPVNVRKLVDCYQHLRNYPKFLEWSSKAVNFKNSGPNDHFYFAQALQESGFYDSARVEFKKSIGTALVDPSTLNNYIESCNWALNQLKLRERYSVKNWKYLNTPYSEFSPFLFHDTLYFVSDRPHAELGKKTKSKISLDYEWTGNSYLKAYALAFPKNKEMDLIGKDSTLHPVSFNPVKDKTYHFGPVVLSPDGNRIYFTRTVSLKETDSLKKIGLKKQDSARYYTTLIGEKSGHFYGRKVSFINRLELWYCDKISGLWLEPKPFPFNGGVLYSVGHPALSKDGRNLYFASDMPGGRGGFDLYSSEVNTEGTFAKPQNLSTINSEGDDEFPMISEDGYLYFSSNGRIGFGGLDLYKARGSGFLWTEVQNLGKPINSDKDDFGYFIINSEANKGIIASNREGGAGSDDLYFFERLQDFLNLAVLENHTGRRIPMVNLKLNTRDHDEIHTYTNQNGETRTPILPDLNYTVMAQKEGFKDTSISIQSNIHQLGNDTLLVFMDSIARPLSSPPAIQNWDTKPEPQNHFTVFYDFNKKSIRTSEETGLKEWLSPILGMKSYRILISSYSDSRGTDIFNYWLSKMRSQSVLDYLTQQGIPKSKIKLSWFGSRKQFNGCLNGVKCTEEEYQLNRRSDIRVITQ